MDRYGRRAGEAPKTVLVYPVVGDAQRRLRERRAMRAVPHPAAAPAPAPYAAAETAFAEAKAYLYFA